MNNNASKFILGLFILVACLLVAEFKVKATKEFKPAGNIFWLELKKKLVPYLNRSIDRSVYKYDIVGPTKEMTDFLGHDKNAQIRFSPVRLGGLAFRRSVFASAKVPGKPDDVLNIVFNLYKYKEVYMLKSGIERGKEVLRPNLKRVSVPIKLHDEKLYVTELPTQKVATRKIPGGIALRKNMLRHEKLIAQGDMVKAKSGSAAITLEFNCRALNSGDKGDEINVMCPDLQTKRFKAVITSAGNVSLL